VSKIVTFPTYKAKDTFGTSICAAGYYNVVEEPLQAEANHIMNQNKKSLTNSKAANTLPIVQRLYASFQEQREHYLQIGLEFEAQLLEDGLKWMQKEFEIAPDQAT
jgi:hypothetical protein